MATVTVNRDMLVVAVNPPRPFSPQIENGDSLADRYATKAALQWIASMRASIDHSIDRLEAFRLGPYGARPANPKAQRKWIGRAKEALGSSLLHCDFTPGTRCRCSFWMDIFGTTPNEDPAYYDGASAQRRWVKIFRIEGVWSGKGKPIETKARDIATFSTHAACRLIQRGGVESEAELRDALRQMWPRLATVEAITRDRRAQLLGDQWLIPVVVKGRLLVGVFVGPRVGQAADTFVAKSFVTVDMLRPNQVRPMRGLVEAFAGQADIAASLEWARE